MITLIKRQEIKTEMNIVPFIDVVLVLLIVFMMASPTIDHGVEVDLPKTSDSGTLEKNDTYILIWTINQNGKFYMSDSDIDSESPLSIDEMVGYTKSVFEKEKSNLNIYIRGDKGVPYDYVVKALSSIKSIGIEKVNLMTKEY